MIRCDHVDDVAACNHTTRPAPGLDAARGLALTAAWHLVGRAGDRCRQPNPRPRPLTCDRHSPTQDRHPDAER